VVDRRQGNDASLLKAEIATAPASRRTDNDVINQVELEDSAGFVDAAREPEIGVGRGGVTRWVIINHDKQIGRMRNHWLKNFARVGNRASRNQGHPDSALLRLTGLRKIPLFDWRKTEHSFTTEA
jgi:hypothetical protein